MLPDYDFNSCYCEPFAGMLGVLLSRPRVKIEIVNDSSERIINLWRVIRDQPEELFEKLDKTLIHESEFKRAIGQIDELEGMDKAVATAIILRCGLHRTAYSYSFSVNWNKAVGSVPRVGKSKDFFMRLNERIKHVQFLNSDALKILDRIKDDPSYVIYVDPPYENASTYMYGSDNQVNHGALMELLKVQKGKVAVSGYDGTYDDLGWVRNEKEVVLWSLGNLQGDQRGKRTEVCWTNYAPARLPTLYEDS